ncbi:MAG TPA: ABC transporter permease [Bryobacteraceae bacterium]|nr:ABC transporter permease [Bryobacteraceae bacterium]
MILFAHASRSGGWPISIFQDLRHGAVLLRRDATVSGLIIAVLALGIGGTAAIFTLLKAAFLDPLPYRDAERLVTIVKNHGGNPTVSEFLEIRARSRTLGPIGFAEHGDAQLGGTSEPVRVFAARVSASFFPLLGINASLGRTFLAEESRPGGTPMVLLSSAFWRSRMGADPSIVGRTLRLDGQSAQVVGVLPPTFHFDYPTLHIAEPVDIYVSYPLDPAAPLQSGGSGNNHVIARLRAGVTQMQAEGELRSIGQALAQEHPDLYRDRDGKPVQLTFEMSPLRDEIVGTQSSLLWLLLGGVGALLLIACANTAQLLLARSLRRGREVAIRVAVGASRLRLIRQFLLEGLVLAVCGGAAGLVVSGAIARLLVALLPERSPLLESAHVDFRAIAFTLSLSVISALVFTILPAAKGSRWTPGPALSARTVSGEGNRWRNAMIATEVALSVFLLCGAGLVAQNLWTLISAPMGFDPDHVLVFRLKEPPALQNATVSQAVFREYLAKITAIPGVDSAATATGPPLRPSVSGPSELVGVTDRDGRLKSVVGDNHLVSKDYFRTLRIPLLAGRLFRDGDETEPWSVTIVNEEFARRFGLGRDVIGKQTAEPVHPLTIVGMVGNVRTRGLRAAPFPEDYLPSLRFSWTNQYLIVRSAMPPAQLVKVVKAAIQSSNSDQAVFGVMTMDELIADSVTEPRFHAYLIGAFALLAVAMAAAGIYSVISFLVSQRTSEIAIRIALGASRGDIVKTVLGTTSLWVATGLAAGLGLGLAASRTIRSLTDTEATASPVMYAGVVLFFLAVTLLAASMPVRRASRLDPAVALRSE